MAIIPQLSLFSWRDLDDLQDLKRLKLVLDTMPDEDLMRKLERRRGRGRDDNPVRGMWNSILAGIVFQHAGVEELIRELGRNAQLREMCGLKRTPSSAAFSRFFAVLFKMEKEVEAVFDRLVAEIMKVLPGFGAALAIDSKAINSHAKPLGKNNPKRKERDGRRDIDADFGCKTYKGKRKDGKPWEKVMTWFGYKLHLVVDAVYELPVAFKVTRASTSDVITGHDLVDELNEDHPEIVDTAQWLAADKAYDDVKLIEKLWDTYGIKPVIDIRNLWKDGEESRLVSGRDNVVHDYKGTVYCFCPQTATKRKMAFGGFEKDRCALKYRCPARQYGVITCMGQHRCTASKGLRIPLAVEPRIFTPLARSSHQWKKNYRKRTAVERVNSRIDVSFGFENHYIRGLRKMDLRCGLALCVMLAMALGRIRENRMDKMRSLVQAV